MVTTSNEGQAGTAKSFKGNFWVSAPGMLGPSFNLYNITYIISHHQQSSNRNPRQENWGILSGRAENLQLMQMSTESIRKHIPVRGNVRTPKAEKMVTSCEVEIQFLYERSWHSLRLCCGFVYYLRRLSHWLQFSVDWLCWELLLISFNSICLGNFPHFVTVINLFSVSSDVLVASSLFA